MCVYVCVSARERMCMYQRRQDNKINVKSIITGLAILADKSSLTAVSTHKFNLGFRKLDTLTRCAIAAAPRHFPHVRRKKKIYYTLFARARASLFTNDKSACRRDRHYAESRPHLGSTLYIQSFSVSVFKLSWRRGTKNGSVLCV